MPSCSLAMPSTRKRVRPGDKVGSSPNSSSTSNLTCFFHCFSSVGVGASCCYSLLWDLWDLSCRWRSLKEQLSCSLAGWDCEGLGEDDWHLLGHQCLNLSLLWEGPLLNPTHPVKWSSLSHLADSTPQGPAEGEWTHEVELMWECLLHLAVGLASMGLLCRPALPIHLVSSWCSSLIHSSCHQ